MTPCEIRKRIWKCSVGKRQLMRVDPWRGCYPSGQSIRGGDLDEWSFDMPKGEALRLGRLPVSKKWPSLFVSCRNVHIDERSKINRRRRRGRTNDRLLSPSLLYPSMMLNISFRPPFASTYFPPMLIVTLSRAWTCNNLLTNRCRICTHTNTPQSLLFSCCGLSSRSWKRNSLPSSWLIFCVANSASDSFMGRRES